MTQDKELIRKDKVLAAVVRTFFKYFALGIIEGKTTVSDQDAYEPRNVKAALIDHFEQVSVVFNTEAFYAFMQINYTEDEFEPKLAAFAAAGKTTPMDMVRFACRSEEFHSCMVAEYKRCFELLLCGSLPTASNAGCGFAECESLGSMPLYQAENIVNRIANQAYSEGKRLTSQQPDTPAKA